MTVSLTPKWKKFIAAQVKARRYESPNDVLDAALRMLQQYHLRRARHLATLNMRHRKASEEALHEELQRRRAELLREIDDPYANMLSTQRQNRARRATTKRPTPRKRRDNQ
jgi:putative addiction module CopG family antidote